MILSEVLSWGQRPHIEYKVLPAGPERWEHVAIFHLPKTACANPSDKANDILLSNIQRTLGFWNLDAWRGIFQPIFSISIQHSFDNNVSYLQSKCWLHVLLVFSVIIKLRNRQSQTLYLEALKVFFKILPVDIQQHYWMRARPLCYLFLFQYWNYLYISSLAIQLFQKVNGLVLLAQMKTENPFRRPASATEF